MNVEIRPAALSDPQVLRLIDELDHYQSKLYPAASNHLDSPRDLERSGAYFVGAFVSDHAVGIGAVKVFASECYAEIKRVYVEQSSRGLGISKQIMRVLENYARQQECRFLKLETGIYQQEALRLYECLGFQYRVAFGDYPEDDPFSVYMEKQLA